MTIAFVLIVGGLAAWAWENQRRQTHRVPAGLQSDVEIPYPSYGEAIGGHSHPTITYGTRRLQEAKAADPDLRIALEGSEPAPR